MVTSTNKALDLRQASLLLVTNYLSIRQKAESLATDLLKVLQDDSATTMEPIRYFLNKNNVVREKEEKTTYLHAFILDTRLCELEELSKKRRLTSQDCSFEGDGSAREAATEEWPVYASEKLAESEAY